MLHVPVALITEKLRGQSLEDDHLKVPREGALQIEGKNVWLSCDGDPTKDQEGNNTTTSSTTATTATTSRDRAIAGGGGGPLSSSNSFAGGGGGGGGGGNNSNSSLSFLPPLNDNDRFTTIAATTTALGVGGCGGAGGGLALAVGPSSSSSGNSISRRSSPPETIIPLTPQGPAVLHRSGGGFPIKPAARVARGNLNDPHHHHHLLHHQHPQYHHHHHQQQQHHHHHHQHHLQHGGGPPGVQRGGACGVGIPPDYAAMRAFDVPPKKKHCRSLSVPADAPPPHGGTSGSCSSISSSSNSCGGGGSNGGNGNNGGGVGGSGGGGGMSTSPQVEGAKVWRPIPIHNNNINLSVPISNNTIATTVAGGVGGGAAAVVAGGAGVGGGVQSSLTQHHHHHQQFASPHHDGSSSSSRTFSSFTAIGGGNGSSATARFHRDFKAVVGSGGSGGGTALVGGLLGSAAVTTGSTPSLRHMAHSPLSVDSGRDTTSDLHTPPSQSPVPRPSSAASLQSSSSLSSSSSYHLLHHHHHHHHHTAFHSASASDSWWSQSSGRSRGEVLQSGRSLSYEEQILSPGPYAGTSGSSPCVVIGAELSGSGFGSGSGGGFGGGGGGGMSGYVPLSPCRSKIPRCHSQPCVLHDRRCAKKRRRDDRPNLDFHKMTETAYPGKSIPTPAQDIQKVRWRSNTDYMSIGGLMPIASSPRDTDLPATPRASEHAAFSAVADLDMAACTALPSTPPASDISSGIDIREPVKLIGEEEEEEEDLEEDDQEEERGSNCGCHRDSGRDDGAGMFPLTDLDLEQIENH